MNPLSSRFFGHVTSGGRMAAELFHDLRQSRGQWLEQCPNKLLGSGFGFVHV